MRWRMTDDKPAMEAMFKTFADSLTTQIAEGIQIEFKGREFKKGVDFPEVAAFVITVASHIPAALAQILSRIGWYLGSISAARLSW